MRQGRLALIAAAVVLLVAGVLWLRQAVSDSGPSVELTHVHGLGINPADGALYVATHDGVYRLPSIGGTPQLVGSGRQDTMGFAVAGPDHFLASGHPAPGQDAPSHLGLIESTDAGSTWTTRSLAGQADLHALRFRHDTVFGYNSVTGELIVSVDRTDWQVRASMPIRDVDVSPSDAQTLLATTETGLQRSGDGGATWSPNPGPPAPLLLAWETVDRLWASTVTGEVHRSADGGNTWTFAGQLAGQATAFIASDSILYAAIDEQGIHRSTDGGATWARLDQLPDSAG
jgi:hypothetical protein